MGVSLWHTLCDTDVHCWIQLESGESRSGSSVSLSKPLPAIPSSRQSSDLSGTPSGATHGPGKTGRFTPSVGGTHKPGE